MKTITIALFIALVLGPVGLVESTSPPSVPFVLSNHQILYNAAVDDHVDPVIFLKVAQCESSLSNSASNGISFGLMQFIPSTWKHYTKVLGIKNPDIWNPQQQATVAAYMFSTGQANQWECFHEVGGILNKVLIKS